MTTSHAPRGYVNQFGYRRVKVRGERRLAMEHRVVWEAAFGPIPRGMEIHHVNEDKLDNRLENLRMLTRLEHKRIHSGCELRDGIWWKRCRACRAFKPISSFYEYRGRNGVMGLCKPCCSQRAVEAKRRRRLVNAQAEEKAPATAGA